MDFRNPHPMRIIKVNLFYGHIAKINIRYFMLDFS